MNNEKYNEIIDTYVDDWINNVQSMADSTTATESFTTWLSSLSLAVFGFAVIRGTLFIEKTWMNQEAAVVVLIISASASLLSIGLTAFAKYRSARLNRKFAQRIFLMRTQRVLAKNAYDEAKSSTAWLELSSNLARGVFFSEVDRKSFTLLSKNDPSISVAVNLQLLLLTLSLALLFLSAIPSINNTGKLDAEKVSSTTACQKI